MAIPGPGIQNMQSQGELIQSMLKDVGITANIKPIAGNDIATNYYINGGGDAFAAAQLASSFFPGAYYDEFGKFQYVADLQPLGEPGDHRPHRCRPRPRTTDPRRRASSCSRRRRS